MVKVHDSEEVANHAGPESCGTHREVCTEALIGDTGRLGIARLTHWTPPNFLRDPARKSISLI